MAKWASNHQGERAVRLDNSNGTKHWKYMQIRESKHRQKQLLQYEIILLGFEIVVHPTSKLRGTNLLHNNVRKHALAQRPSISAFVERQKAQVRIVHDDLGQVIITCVAVLDKHQD